MVDKKTPQTTENILTYLPKIFFVAQILFGIWAAFWILFFHQPKTGDDVEHLHSTWLVFQGALPYVDFFQHHNPLLWYIFAPLMGFFAYDLAIFDAVRIISTVFMLLTLYLASKITMTYMSQSKYAGLLTACAVFPSYVVLSGQDFRPDNYMVCSFFAGLYFFFSYLVEHKQINLIASFFLMFISFMFMQKSIFFLAVIGGVTLYLLIKKQIEMRDFLMALILPTMGAVLFILWLAYHGMIEKYWLCNYIFNTYIPDVYDNRAEPTKTEFYILSAVAFVGLVYFMLKGNICARIICLLWISEAVQRFFYFSLDRHYYYFLDILNAILVGGVAWEIIKRWPLTAYAFVILSFAGCYVFNLYRINNKLPPEYHRYVTPKYILEQTNKCDSVLNGYGLTYGIFTKDNTYYWNLNGQLDVIGSKIGLSPIPDLNAVVEQNLPRIIYTGPFWNEKLHQQHKDVIVHLINPRIRNKYYEQSLFVNVFILKQEYQNQRRCRYDAQTNSWKYYYTR